MREQLKMGLSYDWREFATCDASYYRFEQKCFDFIKAGLAYVQLANGIRWKNTAQ